MRHEHLPGRVSILLLSSWLAAAALCHAETRRDLRFGSDEAELAGTLVLPDGEGPFPGLVFLHGSGPHERGDSLALASRFVGLGVAALIFDKRGCGRSGGSWVQASLYDLATDAAVAYRTLARQPEVSDDAVGFFGPSQAAWIAPIAAADVDPAFLVLMSGGGVSPQESERFAYGRALARANVGKEGVSAAEEALDAYFRYLATGEGRNALVLRLEAAAGRAWARALGLERVLVSEAGRKHWEWVATFEPTVSIETLSMPILLLFGDEDENQPTHRAVAAWREGLEKAGNTQTVVHFFEGADHLLRPTDQTGTGHHGHAAGFTDTVWAAVESWVQEWVTEPAP
ncbi:MAG: alpha/beta fold hydrolase [Thermoanaerobaculia bacterium]|nr:alpha/beta fold hydrolase [Thermoanaerobaculia bacterium]